MYGMQTKLSDRQGIVSFQAKCMQTKLCDRQASGKTLATYVGSTSNHLLHLPEGSIDQCHNEIQACMHVHMCCLN